MIGFREVLREFRVGTRFYEDVYGNYYEFCVSKGPVLGGDIVYWSAYDYEGVEQKFCIKKGHEHYGPKLYWNSP